MKSIKKIAQDAVRQLNIKRMDKHLGKRNTDPETYQLYEEAKLGALSLSTHTN